MILEYIISTKRISNQTYTKFKLEKALEKKYNCSDFYDFHDYSVFVICDKKHDYQKLPQEEITR